MIYLVNFFVCWVLSRKEKLNAITSITILAVLIAIFGFRDHVGTDWNNYVTIYNFYLLDSSYSSPSRGYFFDWISRLFASYFSEVHYLNAFLFSIFVFGIIKYVRSLDWGGYFLLYSLGYLIPVVMVGVRQAAAIGLIFVFTAVYNKVGFIRRVLIVLVAAGFHQSALVFIVTPFVSVMMERGFHRFSIFSIFMSVIFAFLYGFSSDTYSYLVEESVTSLGALQHVMLILGPVALSFFLKRMGQKIKIIDNDVHYVMLFLLLVSVFVLAVNTTTADRMSLYCYPLVAFAVSQQISCKKSASLKIMYSSLGFTTFWFWYFFANNSSTFRNYSNFWL